PFGTQLYIAHYGVCTVTDRMNRRYRNRVDIAMKVTEKDKALQIGFKKLKVTILRSSDQKWILKSRQRRVIDTKLELN
ncbi:MAG: hypothetical protein V3V39_07495, partial [Desulfobacterales bacterium]